MEHEHVTVIRGAFSVYPAVTPKPTPYSFPSIGSEGIRISESDAPRAHDPLDDWIQGVELFEIWEHEPAAAVAPLAERPRGLQHLYNGHCIDDACRSSSPQRRPLGWMRGLLPLLCCFVASCANLTTPPSHGSTPEPSIRHSESAMRGWHCEESVLQVV